MSLLKAGIFHTIPATDCPRFYPWCCKLGVVSLGSIADNVQFPLTSPPTHASGVNAILPAHFALVIFLGSVFAAGAPASARASRSPSQNSQDAAEAARQERARKQDAAGEHHVYTNEDLRRGKILTQEDQLRATATKQKPQPRLTRTGCGTARRKFGQAAGTARRCRTALRNLRREAVHPSPFHLPANQPELAAPKNARAGFLRSRQITAAAATSPAKTFVLVNPSRRRIALRRFRCPCCRRLPSACGSVFAPTAANSPGGYDSSE